ncbi:MAG: oligosaccharide flippase family protein [Methylophilaceae bacterium]|nr:oligosaccharide flippase family protein [Methylophilaceae bacterium]
MNNYIITIKEIFFKFLSTISHQIATLISIPLLANSIDSAEFGKIMTCLILLQFSWVISEWGIPNYSIEHLSKNNDKSEKVDFLNKTIQFQLYCFFILLTLFLILFHFVFKDIDIKLFYYLIPSLFFGIFNFAWFFAIINKSRYIFYITLFSRLTFLFIIFFFISSSEDSYIYLIAQGVTFSLIFGYSVIYLLKKKFISFTSFYNLKDIIFHGKKSFIFFITNLADNQFSILWALCAAVVGGPTMTAIYGLSEQLYRAIVAFSVLLSQTIRINLNFSDDYFLKFLVFLFFSSTIIAFIVFLNLESFLNLFFSNEYSHSTYYAKFIIFPALIHLFIRLINFPIVATFYSIRYVNNLSLVILCLSFVSVALWAYFFRDINSLYFFMLPSLVIHLTILFISMYRFLRVKIN